MPVARKTGCRFPGHRVEFVSPGPQDAGGIRAPGIKRPRPRVQTRKMSLAAATRTAPGLATTVASLPADLNAQRDAHPHRGAWGRLLQCPTGHRGFRPTATKSWNAKRSTAVSVPPYYYFFSDTYPTSNFRGATIFLTGCSQPKHCDRKRQILLMQTFTGMGPACSSKNPTKQNYLAKLMWQAPCSRQGTLVR